MGQLTRDMVVAASLHNGAVITIVGGIGIIVFGRGEHQLVGISTRC